MISLFAHNIKGNGMIRIDIFVNFEDFRNDILEDKHYVVSSIQIG